MEEKQSNKLDKALRFDAFQKIDKIHEVLIGDEYGNKGLIKEVKENSKGIGEIKDERKLFIRIGKIAASIITALGITWASFSHHIKQLF